MCKHHNKDENVRSFIVQLKPHPREVYNSSFYHEFLDEKVDYILRFENLTSDFSKMLSKIGLPQIILPHIEKRERKHYSEYYDSDTKELVRSIFEKDIKIFGYSFDELRSKP